MLSCKMMLIDNKSKFFSIPIHTGQLDGRKRDHKEKFKNKMQEIEIFKK